MLRKILSLIRPPRESLEGKNIILTGVPRSGTTLTCFLLSKIPDMVALNEPLRIGNIDSRQKALKKIRRFYNRTRTSLHESSEAMARATEGGISDNNFSSGKDGRREKIVRKRLVKFDKEFSPTCTVAVKHNALFTILLKELKEIYPTYAIIRNPVAVLGSWNSVQVPVASGSVRAADILEPELNSELEKLDSIIERQLFILDWYFRRYMSLNEEQVIKYEDIIESNGSILSRIHPGAGDLQEELNSRNKSKVYEYGQHSDLYDALLNSNNACWEFYSKDQARAILK